MAELSDLDVEVLRLESRRYRYAGAKEAAIRDELGMSATRYYQLVNSLLDRPEALRAEPLLVHRLRRLRAKRAAARSLSAAAGGRSGLAGPDRA